MKVNLMLAAMLVALAVAAQDKPQCAVVSAMDVAEDWDGPFPPKLVAEPGGRECLRFDFGKGGQGVWSLKSFPKIGIDMGYYNALKFDYRVEGGSFSLSTNVRQWPWYGGHLCLFYQIDRTPGQPEQWTTDIALAPENSAGELTFSRDEPCFQLAFSGAEADPGKELRVFIDNIRLVRYPFTVECVKDIFIGQGEMTQSKDGSIAYRYPLKLTNHTDKEFEVKLDLDTSRLKHFVPKVDNPTTRIPANGSATCPVTLTLAKRDGLPAAYCELAVARFSQPGQPETEYTVNLLPALPHGIRHPSLFATVQQIDAAKKRINQWGWAKQAADWYIKRAGFAMALPDTLPDYKPRDEQPGDRVCPKCGDKTKLRIIDDQSSVHRLQCETCGRMLSPKTDFSHGDDGYRWLPGAKEPPGHAISFNRAGNILDLAVAWRLTGEEKYLLKVVKILREYIRVLPSYPPRSVGIAYEKFDGKGGYRLGDYFSQCGWLNRMACVLDLVWDANVLTPDERGKLVAELKDMAWTRLRLAMALQHRPNEAALGIALLSGDASMLAYLHDNPINGGAVHALKAFILPDGMPDMAGQYLEPAMMPWMDIIQTYRNVGLPIDTEVPGMRNFGAAMALWLDPNGLSPTIGDAGSMTFKPWFAERCYAWYGNPADIALLQRSMFSTWKGDKYKPTWESLPREGGVSVTAAGAALFYCAENIPRDVPPSLRPSHNFPDAGLLVFNQGEGDKQLWAAMPYGKMLGHGFHDNLHLEWWALGQKVSVKQGHRGRQHPVHGNCLIVDGQDQMKVPCQAAEFVGAGPVQGAVISSKDMYPGATMSRTIMLYDGLIFLYDSFASDKEHDFDMVYANAGTAHCGLPFQPRGPLSTEKDAGGLPVNYALFEDVGTVTPPQPVEILWDNLKTPGIGVKLTQFSAGESGELLRVKAPLVISEWSKITGDIEAAGYVKENETHNTMGPSPDRTSLMGTKFIRRLHGKSGALLTILEPFRGGKPRLEGIERLPFTLDGKPSDQGMALRYRADGIAHQVLLCPASGVKELNGVKTSTMFTAGPNGFLR